MRQIERCAVCNRVLTWDEQASGKCVCIHCKEEIEKCVGPIVWAIMRN